jgi:hypothetical protein
VFPILDDAGFTPAFCEVWPALYPPATGGAQPVSREEGPRIYAIVERVAANTLVPKSYPQAHQASINWTRLYLSPISGKRQI